MTEGDRKIEEKMVEKVVVFLLMDGARGDIINKLLIEGRLPHLEKLICDGTYNIITSTFPSTTGPAHIPFFLGKYPGDCNIPGIRWMERTEKTRTQSYTSPYSYLKGSGLNNDLRFFSKTIYEKCTSASIFEPISKGATKKLFSYGHICSHIFNTWVYFDRIGLDYTMHLLRKKKFNLIVTLFTSIDELSHRNHCMHSKVLEAYELFDNKLGKIQRLLDDLYEDSLIIISSDHGLTDTHTHIDLVKILKYTGFSVRSYPFNIKNGHDLFVAESGNSMAHIYFEKNHTDKNMEKINTKLSDIKGIDLILSKSGDIYINKGIQEARIEQKKDKYMYELIKGDPLELESYSGQWFEENRWHEITSSGNYPDSIVQISQIFRSTRCGDIIVTSENGYDLRTLEFPEHKASHGSLSKEHMNVPIILNKKLDSRLLRTLDLYTTMSDYLTGF